MHASMHDDVRSLQGCEVVEGDGEGSLGARGVLVVRCFWYLGGMELAYLVVHMLLWKLSVVSCS